MDIKRFDVVGDHPNDKKRAEFRERTKQINHFMNEKAGECEGTLNGNDNAKVIKQSSNQEIKQSSNQAIKQSSNQAIKQSSNQTIRQ